ncbi:unnamed protein product [Arabidopsis halleri]
MSGAGNTDAGPSNENNMDYFRWLPQYNSLFIELLEEEVQKINYAGTLPYQEGKKNIIKKFQQHTGFKVQWDKFKHKHDDFRSLYAAYKRLRSRTGLSVVVEEGTGKILMDEQWWKDRKKDTPGASRLKKNPLPCIDLMHKVFGPHCAVNDHMISASQIDEIDEEDDEEEQGFEEEDDEDNFTETVPETQEATENHPIAPSMPIEIPTHQRRSRQGGNRGGRNTSRGRGQSSRQTTQTPRRKALMDTHLMNIESYLSTMQNPIQMLNARNQANDDYERDSWLKLNELEDVEKFTDFWWASSEVLRDPFEQKRFVLLRSNEERIRFLEGVTGYDRTGSFRGSPWKRQLSGSSGPSSRGSVGSGSGSPGVGGFAQYGGGFTNIGGSPNLGGGGSSNLGGFSQFGVSGSPNQFSRRQGFQVSNTNPPFNVSPNHRVISGEGSAFRSASSAELLERFNLSDFNRTFRNNDNAGDN